MTPILIPRAEFEAMRALAYKIPPQDHHLTDWQRASAELRAWFDRHMQDTPNQLADAIDPRIHAYYAGLQDQHQATLALASDWIRAQESGEQRQFRLFCEEAHARYLMLCRKLVLCADPSAEDYALMREWLARWAAFVQEESGANNG